MWGISSDKDLRAVLSGPRFGTSPASRLSEVHSKTKLFGQRVRSVEKVNSEEEFKNLKTEWENLNRQANELLLGGTCEHGADQGPRCKKCRGTLSGPWVNSPPGFDALEFAFRKVVEPHCGGHVSDALNLQLDRIAGMLKDVTGNFSREIEKHLEKLEKDYKKRYMLPRKRPSGPLETSVEDVKQRMNPTAKTMRGNQHQFIDQERTRKHPVRIIFDSNLRVVLQLSRADLEADYGENTIGGIETLKLMARDELERRRGKKFEFSSFILHEDSSILDSVDTLLDILDSGDVKLRVSGLTFVSSKSFDTCFLAAQSAGRPDQTFSMLVSTLKRLPLDAPVIELVNFPTVLPPNFFYAISYAHAVVKLDLSFTPFAFADLARIAGTLPSVRELALARLGRFPLSANEAPISGFGYKDLVTGFRLLNDANAFATLTYLDMTNIHLIKPDGSEESIELAELVCLFLRAKCDLKTLVLTGVFHIPKSQSLSDSHLIYMESHFMNQLRFNLPKTLTHLEFDENCFLSTRSAVDLITRFFDIEKVSLRRCRVWSYLEDVVEDHSTTNDFAPIFRTISAQDRALPFSLKSLDLSNTWLGHDGLRALIGLVSTALPFLGCLCLGGTCSELDLPDESLSALVQGVQRQVGKVVMPHSRPALL